MAHRSMAIERTPGYGRFVINDYGLTEGDLLIIVNAYGINAATIDAALEVRRRGVEIIGVTSVRHASETSKDRAARHLSKQDLHELVDVVLDSRVRVGDAVVEVEGLDQPIGAMFPFANVYLLNTLVVEAVQLLFDEGIAPPIWTSGNAPGGDEANVRIFDRFRARIKSDSPGGR
jgi:uncharacterized phosphosugar-binding protein